MSLRPRPLPIEGANVFWTAKSVDRATLQTTLDGLVLNKTAAQVLAPGQASNATPPGLSHFMPEQRTNLACLQYACREYAKENSNKDHLPVVTARKDKNKNGFHVFDVEQNTTKNYATGEFAARVDDHGNITVDVGYADAVRLHTLFGEAKNEVPAGTVGGVLVNIVKYLDGVTLRDRGGLYWIPPGNVDDWLTVGANFEALCKAEVDTMQTKVTTDTLKAVKRAIVKEVTEEAQDMQDAITAGSLGKRALKTKQGKAEELHRRINMIASILGEGLTELHTIVSIPERAAAKIVAQVDHDDVFDAVIG